MSQKLTKRSKTYLQILSVIFNLTDYYSNIFTFDPYDNPTEMNTEIKEQNGITKVRFSFRILRPFQNSYSTQDMRMIMQEYLEFCLLPESELRPYLGGTTQADLLPALYIETIFVTGSYMHMDVIYLDNPLAFRHVKESKFNCITI